MLICVDHPTGIKLTTWCTAKLWYKDRANIYKFYFKIAVSNCQIFMDNS